jgi:epoxyqueuosine reductase QueG
MMVFDQIRNIFQNENIPVFGIGAASKMADERPGHQPEDLLPGTQSLICFGLPVPADVYRMPTYGTETAWRSQNLYYRRLDTLSIRIATLLEESGERAVPTYGCMPLGMNKKGVVVGYLNQIRMGETTGIGTVGKNGLLLHSLYGSRLMLGGVLTTADLPELRYPETDEPGCPPDCRICAEVCPVDAIMLEKKQVKIMRCLNHTAKTPSMSRIKFVLLRAINTEAAARYMSITSFDENTFHTCSKCVALCPYGTAN